VLWTFNNDTNTLSILKECFPDMHSYDDIIEIIKRLKMLIIKKSDYENTMNN
jgi:hypothetical protein